MQVHLCGSGIITCVYGARICTNSLLNYHEERSVRGSLMKHMYQTIVLNISQIRERETAVTFWRQPYCCGHYSLYTSFFLTFHQLPVRSHLGQHIHNISCAS